MSTRNFAPMNYDMPLICGGLGSFEDYKTDEDFTEDDFYTALEWECEDAERMAERFSDTLKYYKVEVRGGYYVGFQFWVEGVNEDYFDLEKESPYCIDNDDANYYYGECRSKVLRKAEAERNRIRKWLNETAAEYGYEDLVCVGVFGNGEAVYERRSRRAELKAAVA